MREQLTETLKQHRHMHANAQRRATAPQQCECIHACAMSGKMCGGKRSWSLFTQTSGWSRGRVGEQILGNVCSKFPNVSLNSNVEHQELLLELERRSCARQLTIPLEKTLNSPPPKKQSPTRIAPQVKVKSSRGSGGLGTSRIVSLKMTAKPAGYEGAAASSLLVTLPASG